MSVFIQTALLVLALAAGVRAHAAGLRVALSADVTSIDPHFANVALVKGRDLFEGRA